MNYDESYLAEKIYRKIGKPYPIQQLNIIKRWADLLLKYKFKNAILISSKFDNKKIDNFYTLNKPNMKQNTTLITMLLTMLIVTPFFLWMTQTYGIKNTNASLIDNSAQVEEQASYIHCKKCGIGIYSISKVGGIQCTNCNTEME